MKHLVASLRLALLALVALVASNAHAQVGYVSPSTTDVTFSRSAANSYTDPTVTGGVNLGSDTTGATFRGVLADYASVLGGDQCVARGQYATAWGLGAVAHGVASTAGGYYPYAPGLYATAFGDETVADGARSFACGYVTYADGLAAHAEGQYTRASGDQSHAEGYANLASGGNAHAEGSVTNATGYGSHAENVGTYARGGYTHVEGEDSVADGMDSHAEGFANYTDGHACHAEGRHNWCSGDASSAHGASSKALREEQWSLGSGDYSNMAHDDAIPPPHMGEAQTSMMVFRGTTPGTAAGETVALKYGYLGASTFYAESSHAYGLEVTTILTGTISGSPAAVTCKQHAMMRDDAGVITIVAGVATCLGDSAASSWSVGIAPDAISPYLDFTATTGTTTSAIKAVAKVELTETIY